MSDALPELLPEHIDRHLLDAKVGEQSGGTGRSFDWRLLPKHSDLMLAGGLSAENVAQAAQLGCRGLDFNSGVESAPGKKDANQLQQVFQQLRNY
ncbi:indole-3-glycerol phosphate synthase/phosphoribosylanthranilate isomerase [Vibrio cholerae B33]|nr:indole-3-glycerol phosphate synthase/phosphoribosylanthranilate isomerase [Vibrio cholerae B33]